jgi:hypothetical protein
MQKIAALSEALNVLELRPQATEILRGLISEVRMVPDATVRGGHHIVIIPRHLATCSMNMWPPP